MQAKLGYSAYGGVFCPTKFLTLPAIFTICRVVCMHPAPSFMHPGYFLNGTVCLTPLPIQNSDRQRLMHSNWASLCPGYKTFCHLAVTFPYFMQRSAPDPSYVPYGCTYIWALSLLNKNKNKKKSVSIKYTNKRTTCDTYYVLYLLLLQARC